MWIDTHLHLDASEFDADRDEVIARAMGAGVSGFLIPAVHHNNFETVRTLAHDIPGAVYMLGIHPMYVERSEEDDLDRLNDAVAAALNDPKFAGIGEIGLDGFVPDSDMARQERFFLRQLKIARQFELPVVMHVRRAQDLVLKGLKRIPVISGIAHAFNGSEQQAKRFVEMNCALGFGGAATFDRALQIRRLIQTMPDHALVLETDSPDIAPNWMYKQRNEPGELPSIAEVIADIRGVSLGQLALMTRHNAVRLIPALASA